MIIIILLSIINSQIIHLKFRKFLSIQVLMICYMISFFKLIKLNFEFFHFNF